ncbi:MAG: SRPBCC family protein [Granulosicoccaceae bacterium]
MKGATDLAGMLRRRRAGYSLEQAFYKDESIFEADLQLLFYREWLFVGHDVDIPCAGDWVNRQFGDANVVIVRNAAGDIRAFHNSCRHRGSKVCLGERGNSANLVCPYHQWTYDLDGNLSFAKEMGGDFDPKAHGLHGVHCCSVEGLLFICLANQAPDITPLREQVGAYLKPHRLKQAKVAYRSSIVEQGNWKLVVENNRECYHCAGSHPELCRTYSDDPAMTGVSAEGDASAIAEHWDKCESLGLDSRFHLADSGQFRVQRIPLTEGAESFTLSRQVASAKPMVDSAERALGSLLLFHYPNTWNHFLSDYAVTFVVTPLGPQQTRVETTWLVHEDAVEGVDYQLDELTAVWLATNDQDRELVENNQLGVNSPAYVPGPYSTIHEDGVSQFIDWYCDFMVKGLTAQPKPDQIAERQGVVRPLPLPTMISAGPPPSHGANEYQAPVTLSEIAESNDPNSKAMAEQVSRFAEAERQSPYVYLEHSAPWVDRDQLLEVVSVVPEVKDTKTFTFRPDGGGYFSFAPGQFITLELPINGETQYRTYTISSSPSRPMSLSVTVKAQSDSVGTRWMLDHLQLGMKLRAHGPAGHFHLYNYPARKYCFISAGSGITPMMSMTNFLFDRGSDLDISFIHSARKPSDIIFRKNVENWVARVPGISLSWIVAERDEYAAWSGYIGRFNQLILELSTPDFYEREVFCCGPEPFMQTVRDVLIAVGFDMDRYHEESFAAPVLEESAGALEHEDTVLVDAKPAQVHFSLTGTSASSHQGETLLQAVKSAGLNIPSACNFGVCGTCKVKVLSGETHMVHNGGIRDAEVEEGYVLACCTRPVSDVSLLL